MKIKTVTSLMRNMRELNFLYMQKDEDDPYSLWISAKGIYKSICKSEVKFEDWYMQNILQDKGMKTAIHFELADVGDGLDSFERDIFLRADVATWIGIKGELKFRKSHKDIHSR